MSAYDLHMSSVEPLVCGFLNSLMFSFGSLTSILMEASSVITISSIWKMKPVSDTSFSWIHLLLMRCLSWEFTSLRKKWRIAECFLAYHAVSIRAKSQYMDLDTGSRYTVCVPWLVHSLEPGTHAYWLTPAVRVVFNVTFIRDFVQIKRKSEWLPPCKCHFTEEKKNPVEYLANLKQFLLSQFMELIHSK